MNKGLLTLILAVVMLATGVFLGSRIKTETDTAGSAVQAADAKREVQYWVAPMDPNFRSETPGKSPMGMDLVPVYVDEAASGDTVTINPAVENNLGVRTQAASLRPLWRRIEATGYVGFDETRISHINLRTQGWIVKLLVNAEGERVAKGDLLFELYAPELVNAQKEYLQASQRGGVNLKRGAKGKLKALGMISAEIDKLERTGMVSENIQVIAPQDGIVSSLSVREGMFVQPNTAIMSLADLSSVWLQAEVFESQAEWVAEGQAAEARLDYLPGRVFSGQVDYIYPVLDPATRTLRVRLRFENSDEELKPNMYARVSVFGRLRPSALTIPREALIRAPEHDRVVVSLGEGRFQVHEVLTGMESGEWVEIVAGIGEGDLVVTSAQFMLDSEASLTGSIHRLSELHDAVGSNDVVRAFGSGWIDAVNVNGRKLRVSHGPIDQLGWPSMTMDFQVDQQVDLAAFEAGQDIRFMLRQEDAGEFVIEQALLRDASASVTREQAFPGEFPAVTGAAQTLKFNGQAVIVSVALDEHALRLAHEPITALGWPAMTMNFAIAPELDISGFEAGQTIHFSMHKQGEGYVIDQVHVIQPAAASGEQDHD